jgi:hypothetical protein
VRTIAAPPGMETSRVSRKTGSALAKAPDLAIDIAVEHGIADDQRMYAGELFERGGQGEASSSGLSVVISSPVYRAAVAGWDDALEPPRRRSDHRFSRNH